jgi:hypothetical protein
VRVGSTSVTLQACAGGGGSGGGGGVGDYVWAHSDANAILRARPFAARAFASAAADAAEGWACGQSEPPEPEPPSAGPPPREPRPPAWRAPTAATELVAACRVVGAEGLRAAAPLRVAGEPGGVAWVSPGGRLCLGALDPNHRLRWAAAPVGGAPRSVAWHAPSGCVAVVTEEHGGPGSGARPSAAAAAALGAPRRQVLRMLEGRGLRQVAALELDEACAVTAVEVLRLPCSSGGAPSPLAGCTRPRGAGGAAPPASAAGARPFLVVAATTPPHAQGAACRGLAGAFMTHRPAEPEPGGLLAFFDVRCGPDAGGGASGAAGGGAGGVAEPGGGGGSSGSGSGASSSGSGGGGGFELLLVGAVPVDAPPTALCTVAAGTLDEPAPDGRRSLLAAVQEQEQARARRARQRARWRGRAPRQDGGAAATAAEGRAHEGGGAALEEDEEQLLLVGSTGGVTAYRVWLDDVGASAAAGVEAELAAAAAAAGGGGAPAPMEVDGRAAAAGAAPAPPPRVVCAAFGSVACANMGAVLRLRPVPGGRARDTAVAYEALGSATIVRAAVARRSRRVRLLAPAAEASGALAADAAPLGRAGRAALLAAHPGGLVAVRREAAAEELGLAEMWERTLSGWEAGEVPRDVDAHIDCATDTSGSDGEGGGGGEAAAAAAAARRRRAWRPWPGWRQQLTPRVPREGPRGARALARLQRWRAQSTPGDLFCLPSYAAPPMPPISGAAGPPGASLLVPARLGLCSAPRGGGGASGSSGGGAGGSSVGGAADDAAADGEEGWSDVEALEGSGECGLAGALAPLLCFSSCGAATAAALLPWPRGGGGAAEVLRAALLASPQAAPPELPEAAGGPESARRAAGVVGEEEETEDRWMAEGLQCVGARDLDAALAGRTRRGAGRREAEAAGLLAECLAASLL